MEIVLTPSEFAELVRAFTPQQPADPRIDMVSVQVLNLSAAVESFRRETRMAGEDLKALVAEVNANVNNIDADITRILERVPAEGGLDAAATAELRESLTALKDRTATIAAREPETTTEPTEPPVTDEPVGEIPDVPLPSAIEGENQ